LSIHKQVSRVFFSGPLPDPAVTRLPVSHNSPRPAAVARSAGRLFLGTLASRLLGFLRVLLMARYFGAGRAMDQFNIAFLIPNLFRRVLGEQAIESAFLPTFRSLLAKGRPRTAWRTASVVLNWLMVALVLAAVGVWALAPWLVSRVLAPGFAPEGAAASARLGRLMSPFLVLIGLSAFVGSLLLAHRQTWAYGAVPTLFNVGCIGTMVLFHRPLGVRSLAVGVVVGGTLQLGAGVWALGLGRRRGVVQGGYRPRAGFRDAAAGEAVRLAGPVCAAAVVARLASVVDRAIASFLEVGSVSALYYAMYLLVAASALFGLSVGRAALVPLSERAASGDARGFQQTVGASLHLGLFLLVPLSAATALLARPLAELLRGGAFQLEQTRMTAGALRYYALGLAPMGMVMILARALHAMKETAAPFRASFRALYVNVLLSAALALTPLRHCGIALATSVAMGAEAGMLFRALRGRLRGLGAPGGFSSLWRAAGRIGLGTTGMLVAAGAAWWLGVRHIPAAGFVLRCVRLGLVGTVGAAAYGGLMWVLDRSALGRLWSGGGA
jgi:putative peptidoglycan lipid II flippase